MEDAWVATNFEVVFAIGELARPMELLAINHDGPIARPMAVLYFNHVATVFKVERPSPSDGHASPLLPGFSEEYTISFNPSRFS